MSPQAAWVRWLPWISLAAFTALWIARWSTFPLVLDPYYHLLIAQQIADAGGPIAYEWWEYAPVGRPHLYPPMLHLVLAMGLKLGWAPLTVIRLVSVTFLPLLLLSLFLVVRRLFTPSLALTCVLVGMVPFSFHLHSAITLAATLGMIELLWLVDALEHGRCLAAGLLISLLCYTHLGLPLMALITVCCAAILRPAIWRVLLRASWGVVLAVPWYVHLIRYRAWFHPMPRLENTMVECMPLLYLAAALGLWSCWRMKGRAVWWLGCWTGFAALARHYPYRWLSGEGVLPIVLLAGMGVSWLAERLVSIFQSSQQRQGSSREGNTRHLRASLGIVFLLFCSPTLLQTAHGWRWFWPDSAPAHLLSWPGVVRKEVDTSLYSPAVERLAREVARQTRPQEIIWSNAPYAIGLIAALAHRPIASAMFNEVAAPHSVDAVRAAHVVVWLKIGDLPGMISQASLARYPLTLIAETDLAMVLRQAGVSISARVPVAVMPLSLAMVLLGASVALIVWDLRRPRHPSRIPV